MPRKLRVEHPGAMRSPRAILQSGAERVCQAMKGISSERWFDFRRKIFVAAILLLLPACSEHHHQHSVALLETVTSPAASYPFALRWQSQLAPGTYLNSVLVVWERDRSSLKVGKIAYGFAPI